MTRFEVYRGLATSDMTSLWRLVLGVVLIILLALALIFLFMIIASFSQTFRLLTSNTDSLIQSREVLTLLAVSMIAIIGPCIYVVHRFLQRRSFFRLLSHNRRLNSKELLAGSMAALVFSLVQLLVGVSFGFFDIQTIGFAPQYIYYIVPVVLVLFLQVSAEELLFRGYLLQGLAARFRSPLVWMLFPSLLFGLAHITGTSSNDITYFFLTLAMGLALSISVWKTGGLSFAIGCHFVNNLIWLTVMQSSLSPLGIGGYKLVPIYDGEFLPVVMIISILAFLVLVILVLFRSWPANDN